MPRPARPKKEVQRVKEEILEKALDILIDEGYDNLSMSKIGKQMKMTSANLYNYYQNKDELYNSIIIKGYNILSDELKNATETAEGLFEKIMALCRSYLNFGLTNPHYYHLMFSMISPKYKDYIGTPLESIAFTEKQNSMRVLEFAITVVENYVVNHTGFDGIDSKLFAMQLWSQLHGLISLHNSGNLNEADDNTEQIINGIMNNIKIIIKKGFK